MIPGRIVRSTAFRLAFLYMALFGTSVLVLLGFIYHSTAGFMDRQTDETINAEVRGLTEQYSQQGLSGLVRAIESRVARDKNGGGLYLLTDWKFSPLAGNLREWPDFDATQDGWVDTGLREADGERVFARLKYFLLPGNHHLLVGRDVAERNTVEDLIMDALVWGLVITVAMGGLGAVLMTRGMLGRLDVINRASREIMRGDLTRRIPAKGTGDEFDQLTGNLNDMLDRISGLMDGVRHVSDNIAHDLRGPLNRIRTRLELALPENGADSANRKVLERTIADIDEVLGAFHAILTISQAEAGSRREEFAVLDLARLAEDVAELYEPLAEDKGLRLCVNLSPGVAVSGNRHLLSQALANLVDNAIKYTPSGGEVGVELTSGPDGPELAVRDSGPGVPPEHRQAVLERFHRLESSRNAPGSGLGLSLVAAVAKLHGATLVLADAQPGLRVSLAFPPVEQAAPIV
ncbi:HAMP domain-containing histidine kinase [Desulfovibrio sulfodismutans]|uniref:histidine kinase n=1 Tax=Desulfolutivibrio sulfodismutans TaxID=63561 RepID=A0A7K3NM33_9BACT|nr:HAMP domain-containing sensor histidine kinase [Desulfolutivibrio sulfodismutans]NDY56825.1 HAMP domain-containing histidine kinase [Desulfolutivibrio sulfodismutans]QLA13907.1 HAMP domain-containing protein [Desulfolutivibrio sulfodismutans DSM 3696]